MVKIDWRTAHSRACNLKENVQAEHRSIICLTTGTVNVLEHRSIISRTTGTVNVLEHRSIISRTTGTVNVLEHRSIICLTTGPSTYVEHPSSYIMPHGQADPYQHSGFVWQIIKTTEDGFDATYATWYQLYDNVPNNWLYYLLAAQYSTGRLETSIIYIMSKSPHYNIIGPYNCDINSFYTHVWVVWLRLWNKNPVTGI